MSTKIQVGPARREEFDSIIRKVAKEHGAAVEAALDKRYTYQDEGKVRWGAYERYYLSTGHTLYLNLQTKEATVSSEPDKHAMAKIEKREAKAKKGAERKALKVSPASEKAAPPTVSDSPLPVKRASKYTAEQADRITAIIRERKCTRKNAIKVLRNEEAIKAADMKAEA